MSMSEIINWINLAKGDFTGHPFRGNQFTQGAAEKLADKLGASMSPRGTSGHMEAAADHVRLASYHLEKAKEFTDKGFKAHSPGDMSEHFKVADAHRDAAFQHMEAAKSHDIASGDDSAFKQANRDSNNAAEATSKAHVAENSQPSYLTLR